MSLAFGIILAAAGGAIAGGAVLYVLGRRVERRVADAATRLAARERERQLKEAQARMELEARAQLERVAGLSVEDAKAELKRGLEDEARSDAAALLRDIREQAQKNA